MFLVQVKPEMDDFEEEEKKYFNNGKILYLKFQYLKKYFEFEFLTDTLAKMSQNIFVYSFCQSYVLDLIDAHTQACGAPAQHSCGCVLN